MALTRQIRIRERGATLLEALAGLAVLGILIGLAAAELTDRSPKYRLLKIVREIHSRMNHARYKAIYAGTKVRLIEEEFKRCMFDVKDV